jgi:hypothetical protein
MTTKPESHDRADELLVDALLDRVAHPVDPLLAVKLAIAKAHAEPKQRPPAFLRIAIGLAAAIITVLVFVLARHEPESVSSLLDRAAVRAAQPIDREYLLSSLPGSMEARLLLRGRERMLVELRGPFDQMVFRAGYAPSGGWAITPTGVEVGEPMAFGTNHPLPLMLNVIDRTLSKLRKADDIEMLVSGEQPGHRTLRSAREDVQVTIDARTGEVQALDLSWIIGRMRLQWRATATKQDLIYEHMSYHAPGDPISAPSGEFSISSLFGMGGDFPFFSPRGR